MKGMWIAGACSVLAFVIGTRTHASAQAEIDPDHYETPAVAPQHQSTTETKKAKQAAVNRVRSDCHLANGGEKVGDCSQNKKQSSRGRVHRKATSNVAMTKEKKLR